ncbi:MAG: IS1634 family transposase [Actinomycetota bacterium]
MASLYPKKVSGKTYWYLREMARVAGKPKMVSERYVGSAEEVARLLDAREQAVAPQRTRHLAFGDVAAAWGLLTDVGVAQAIDEAVGPGPSGLPVSVGTYLALAALNRLVAPCSKAAFADWWRTTAADRFTKIPAAALDHRRFWDAMHATDQQALTAASQTIATRIVANCGVDISSVALDMTNFATFIATDNGRAPIAQRGKAKQKRADLRLVGLGLVVTRHGGIPLAWHAYPGDRPDVTQFATMITELADRYTGLTAALGRPAEHGVDLTVVFDAGQNSEDNFAHLTTAGLHYVGSVPISDCPDLAELPASVRREVDPQRFPGLSAYETRRVVYGVEHRVVLTHSPELHAAQVRGFDGTTLAKAVRRLDDLAATLVRGRTRRSREQVEAAVAEIVRKPWVRRVIAWELSGTEPKELRLTWRVDPTERATLEEELFGKHVLITDHDDWTVAEVVAGYRSQSEAEFSFRQLKDPHVVSFSPMHHFTKHNILVHTFTCVLALQLAHLMRYRARQAGLGMSVRVLLEELASIGETVLIYQGERGRPKARRMLTETSPTQQRLTELFHLDRYAPRR